MAENKTKPTDASVGAYLSWTGVLDQGATFAAVLAAISTSQENIDGTALVIGTGFEYTRFG